jgi:hypothetical protein
VEYGVRSVVADARSAHAEPVQTFACFAIIVLRFPLQLILVLQVLLMLTHEQQL